MALFPCPECGRQISDKADACPQCGYPVARLREESTAQETITLTVHLPVITCNYDKGYSLFRIYAQMEHRDVYATFFGGPAAPASIAIRDENENPLPFPAAAEISATNTVLEMVFSMKKAEANALSRQIKHVVLERTLLKSDPLLQPCDGTTPRCPRCGSTAVQLVKENFDLGGAVTGGLLFGSAGFVVGALSGDELQRVCINCGHKF